MSSAPQPTHCLSCAFPVDAERNVLAAVNRFKDMARHVGYAVDRIVMQDGDAGCMSLNLDLRPVAARKRAPAAPDDAAPPSKRPSRAPASCRLCVSSCCSTNSLCKAQACDHHNEEISNPTPSSAADLAFPTPDLVEHRVPPRRDQRHHQHHEHHHHHHHRRQEPASSPPTHGATGLPPQPLSIQQDVGDAAGVPSVQQQRQQAQEQQQQNQRLQSALAHARGPPLHQHQQRQQHQTQQQQVGQQRRVSSTGATGSSQQLQLFRDRHIEMNQQLRQHQLAASSAAAQVHPPQPPAPYPRSPPLATTLTGVVRSGTSTQEHQDQAHTTGAQPTLVRSTAEQQQQQASFRTSPIQGNWREAGGVSVGDGHNRHSGVLPVQPTSNAASGLERNGSVSAATVGVSVGAGAQAHNLLDAESAAAVAEVTAAVSSGQALASGGGAGAGVSGGAVHVCETCGEGFPSNLELQKHDFMAHKEKMTTRNAVGRFECVMKPCTLSFVRRHVMERHVRTIHLMIRDFSCPTCDRVFADASTRDAHKSAVHDKLKPWVCNTCDRQFTQSASLGKHKRRFHRGDAAASASAQNG